MTTIQSTPEMLLTERRAVHTSATSAPTYRQCLPAFGWRLVESESTSSTLMFERNRGIPYRNDLSTLQHEFEAGLERIARLERIPKRLGALSSIAIGVLGVGAIAASVFAFLAGLIPLFVGASLLGALLCGLSARVHGRISERFEAASADRMDAEYARLSALYADAVALTADGSTPPPAR